MEKEILPNYSKCLDCGLIFVPEIHSLQCPECSGRLVQFPGKVFVESEIIEVEVEDEDE